MILHANTSRLAAPGDPASVGEAITIYGSGLGGVSPDVEAGAPSPSQPLAVVPKTVEVTIGGKTATTLFAGLALPLTRK